MGYSDSTGTTPGSKTLDLPRQRWLLVGPLRPQRRWGGLPSVTLRADPRCRSRFKWRTGHAVTVRHRLDSRQGAVGSDHRSSVGAGGVGRGLTGSDPGSRRYRVGWTEPSAPRFTCSLTDGSGVLVPSQTVPVSVTPDEAHVVTSFRRPTGSVHPCPSDEERDKCKRET